jgi:hypothetical protein
MQAQHNAEQTVAAVELARQFETQPYAHANALVLEPLPRGEFAWLKPEDDEPRYVLTEQGHRALAMARLFDKGPTVAEVKNCS